MRALIRGPQEVSGVFEAPPSKSYTHRYAFSALLASGRSVLEKPLISGDTRATLKLCEKLGAEIKLREDRLRIKGVSGNPEIPDDVIDVGNSGTTLRIGTAISSLCDGYVVLTGDESIRRRPMAPLLESLRDLGAFADSSRLNGLPPVIVRGPLLGGRTMVDGSISSQFISALLFASPFSRNEDIRIEVRGNLVSRPYIEMTLAVLEEAGASIDRSPDLSWFEVERGGLDPLRARIPGDYSSASFLIAASLITGSEIRIRGLKRDDKQADRAILDVAKEMGAEISWKGEELLVRGGELRGIFVNARDFPDLVPVIALLGCFASGCTEIRGVRHARFKESDRILVTARELSKMGARIEVLEDGLRIWRSELRGARVSSRGDHRIAMMLSIAALGARGETVVEGVECVDVSFPGFFDILRSLGVDLEIVE